MDYPQLNFIFGLGLMFTLVVNICLRLLLSKLTLPKWMSILSWIALALSICAALYIGILFLRAMTPTFNRQIVLGLLLMGGIGALITGFSYRRKITPPTARLLFGIQIIASVASVILSFGLYCSLVPI